MPEQANGQHKASNSTANNGDSESLSVRFGTANVGTEATEIGGHCDDVSYNERIRGMSNE